MRSRAWAVFFSSILSIVIGACASSSSSGSAGTTCKASSDCGSGLSCLSLAVFSDGGCSSAGNACSKACTTDADCATLGPKYKCFEGCPGAPKACGATP